MHEARVATFLQVGDAVIGGDLHIRDLHRPQPRVGHELEICHGTDAEALLDGLPDRLAAADLDHAVDFDLCLFQRLFEGEAGCRALLAQDEVLALKLGDPDRLAVEPSVPGIHEDDHLVVTVGDHLDPGVVIEMGDHRDVRVEFDQPLQGEL